MWTSTNVPADTTITMSTVMNATVMITTMSIIITIMTIIMITIMNMVRDVIATIITIMTITTTTENA